MAKTPKRTKKVEVTPEDEDKQRMIAVLAAILLSHKPFDGEHHFAGLTMPEKRMGIMEARDLLEMAGESCQ
jgi:hypothetical protein